LGSKGDESGKILTSKIRETETRRKIKSASLLLLATLAKMCSKGVEVFSEKGKSWQTWPCGAVNKRNLKEETKYQSSQQQGLFQTFEKKGGVGSDAWKHDRGKRIFWGRPKS